eukprot:scaffold8005_cov118-Isochrysis_galbana.AAC.4
MPRARGEGGGGWAEGLGVQLGLLTPPHWRRRRIGHVLLYDAAPSGPAGSMRQHWNKKRPSSARTRAK